MTEFRTRLRSVRMKNGGAEIRVLHSTPSHDDDVNWRGQLVANAKAMAEYGDLDGYVIVTLYADGTRSSASRFSQRLPREMLPAYIAEIVRSDGCTARVAAEEFDRRFKWVER